LFADFENVTKFLIHYFLLAVLILDDQNAVAIS